MYIYRCTYSVVHVKPKAMQRKSSRISLNGTQTHNLQLTAHIHLYVGTCIYMYDTMYVCDLQMKNQNTSSGGSNERIVTVTGGPSPRLMRIIASSYKSKDSTTSVSKASAGVKPYPVVKRRKVHLSGTTEGFSETSRQERGETVDKQHSCEGTDM